MVRLEHVNKYFNRRKKNEIHVINDTTLQMENKGLVALLGPSGCGKTTLLNVIGGLDKIGSGNIYINGEKLNGRRAGKIDQIRNLNVGYIFQNYNLVDNMTVFDNVAIALKMVGVKDKKEIEEKVNYVLDKVGMYRYRNRYADMLSGGERQRVGIARAIVKNPAIVIADEPTGNLDSRTSQDVLGLLKITSQKFSQTIVMITHDLGVVANIADRVAVMYAGDIVEIGTADEIYYDPRHPYTWALLSSMPQMGIKGEDLFNIVGTPPNLFAEIRGDAFAPRNPQALKIDYVKRPPYFEVSPTHKAKTWLLDPRAPHIEPPAAVKKLQKEGL